MKRQPTKQQQNAIDTHSDPMVKGLKLVAVAGAGKTSTLEMMANAVVAPSLYLCFNKSNADEAKGRFPKHVDCRTGHSAAFVWGPGRRLSSKLNRPKGGYVNVAFTGSEIARFFNIFDFVVHEDMRVPAAYLGLLVRVTVARFEQSADAELSMHHVPKRDIEERLKDAVASVNPIRELVFAHAKRLWAERINDKSPVMITPDTYLKLYQLSKPVFHGTEVLYVDEYQDTTPCMHDIVMNQLPHMKVVVVGDARQAIYGWRGAVNAMNMVNFKESALTKSFRYGQAVADVATAVLEGAMKIQGLEAIKSVVGRTDVVDTTQPHTRLFRTNAALLTDALTAIDAGIRIAIEIDTKDFCKLLESAVALYDRDKKGVKHDKIVPYSDWDDLKNEAKHDNELSRVAKMVEGGTAVRAIRILQDFKNADDPHITFTTAHKSKGREWKQVWLMDDFKTGFNEDGEWEGLSEEEQNLLYVACTRAQERLQYNAVAAEYIRRWEAEMPLESDDVVGTFDDLVKSIVREEQRLLKECIEA